MEPFTLIMGLVAVGSSALGFIKQQQENDAASTAAALAVQQAKADLAAQQANNDYSVLAAELKTKADALAAKHRVAELTAQRIQLEKNGLLLVALLGLLGAVIMLAQHKQVITGRRPGGYGSPTPRYRRPYPNR